jgi:tRNA pseudouridine55 synthase
MRSQIGNQKSKMIAMNGMLIIDKPAGLTSHDVVARVRRILCERRVGHTGTLDPFATGVLVLLVGRVTRLARFLSIAEKEYEAVIRLGYATDSGDLTGKRVTPNEPHAKAQSPQGLRKEDIEAAMAMLRGEIQQTPPMYSAKKVGGRKLYELARRGEEVERKAVPVAVKEFEPLSFDGRLCRQNDDTCDLSVRVICSAGTYVRALAESLGKHLGVGAHLAELRRTRAGDFRIEEAISLDELERLAHKPSLANAPETNDAVAERLISPDAALSHLPFWHLDADSARRVRNGIDVLVNGAEPSLWEDGQQVRLRSGDADLVAVAVYDKAQNILHPTVVVAVQE